MEQYLASLCEAFCKVASKTHIAIVCYAKPPQEHGLFDDEQPQLTFVCSLKCVRSQCHALLDTFVTTESKATRHEQLTKPSI
jgi:hypothetical protein